MTLKRRCKLLQLRIMTLYMINSQRVATSWRCSLHLAAQLFRLILHRHCTHEALCVKKAVCPVQSFSDHSVQQPTLSWEGFSIFSVNRRSFQSGRIFCAVKMCSCSMLQPRPQEEASYQLAENLRRLDEVSVVVNLEMRSCPYDFLQVEARVDAIGSGLEDALMRKFFLLARNICLQELAASRSGPADGTGFCATQCVMPVVR